MRTVSVVTSKWEASSATRIPGGLAIPRCRGHRADPRAFAEKPFIASLRAAGSADAVIFAVGIDVRGRQPFAGLPAIKVPVNHGIDEPAKLIQDALALILETDHDTA
jgi:hypothetical protein